MKIKLLKLLIVCSLIYSCGFTPILKDYENTNIEINKINFVGSNNELIYFLKNYLSLTENKKNGVNINFTVTESSVSVERDSAGVTIKEKLALNIEMVVLNFDNKIINRDTFSESKDITITSNPEIDNTTKDNERKNILRNLTQKIKFKIMVTLKNSK